MPQSSKRLLSTYNSKYDSNYYYSLISVKNSEGTISYYLKSDYGNFEKIYRFAKIVIF